MIELYRHRRLVITLALLYLSQGIPIGIAMDALPTLLRRDGAPLHALAFLPLVGIPWVVKFLWAPWVDNHWSKKLGRRRSWILPMQTLVLGCMATLALIGVNMNTAIWAVGLLAIASLCSATQDIATDSIAAEHCSGSLLAKVNALQVACVMIGFYIAGAGTLLLSGRLGQSAAFGVLLFVPLCSLACVWFWPLEDARERPQRELPKASLIKFLRKPQALALLVLALLSAMTAVSGFGLSKLYLNDAGWTLEDIGTLGLAGGAITVFLGCGGGAWLVKHLGVWRSFGLGITLAGVSAALWFSMADEWLPLTSHTTWVCIVLGSLATGITSVSIMTAAMRYAADGAQAGTDVTAVQSTRDLGELIASSSLLALTAKVGYPGAFLGGVVLAVLAVVVVARVAWTNVHRLQVAIPIESE